MATKENDVRSVLSKTPSILRALIEAAPVEAIDFHEKEGAWSPEQVLPLWGTYDGPPEAFLEMDVTVNVTEVDG